jgi:hypothetical protein
VIPRDLPKGLRQLAGFVVEVDAMSGGYMCSASLKASLGHPGVKETVAGGRPIRKLFTKDQRRFFAEDADGIELDDLSVLGPITVMKLKFSPQDFDRRLVAELWWYPDASRILELSTRCGTTEPFQVPPKRRPASAAGASTSKASSTPRPTPRWSSLPTSWLSQGGDTGSNPVGVLTVEPQVAARLCR